MRLRVAAALTATLTATLSAALIAVPLSTTHASARRVTTATVTLPPANAQFDYQLGGSYQPVAGVGIVDRDSTSKPYPGVYNICYVNAFQTQAYQGGWWGSHHSNLLLRKHGKLVEDPGWPGEIILDTSTAAKRSQLLNIIGGWENRCKQKGFQAIEADNLDSNTRSHHLLTQADDIDFAALLAARAHADGLAFAQKNDAELGADARKQVGFDFAIAESCQVYSECDHYLHDYGDEVFEIEYRYSGFANFQAACRARGSRISIIYRDVNVVPRGHKGYVYKSC